MHIHNYYALAHYEGKMTKVFTVPSVVGAFWIFAVIAAEPTSIPGSGSGQVCPTWYTPVENASATHENCTCGSELGGKVRCKVSTKEVAVLSGYCLTYSEILQQTVVGYCSYSNAFNHTELKENRAGYVIVPKDRSCQLEQLRVFAPAQTRTVVW